jgi:oligopeptidase B
MLNNQIVPPMASRIEHNVHFGHIDGQNRGDCIMTGDECIVKNDHYNWLRSDDRSDPYVLDYLERENKYTSSKLFEKESDKKLYDDVKKELKSYIVEDYESIKSNIGNSLKLVKYFYRNISGKSHRMHYLQQNNIEYLLLDENNYKVDGELCDISNIRISYNHKYLTFCLDKTGDEMYDLFMFDITDLDNHVKVNHNIDKLLYADYLISKDERFIFYIMGDNVNRPCSLYIYDIVKQQSKKIFQENNTINDLNIRLSSDKEFLFVTSSSYKTNTTFYCNVSNINFDTINYCTGNEQFISSHLNKIQDGMYEEKYYVDKIHNYFVILTNKLGNKNFIPMYCAIDDDTCQSKWNFINKSGLELKLNKSLYDVIYYSDITVTNDYVIFEIRFNGITKLATLGFNGDEMYPFFQTWEVLSPYNDSSVIGIYNVNNSINEITIKYSSLSTPNVFMNFNVNSKNCTVIKKDVIPNYNSDDYTTIRTYAVDSKNNNVKIPISMIYKSNLMDSEKPYKLHLYAYGSYGCNVEPIFNNKILPLLNRGYIYAIAHVRGSSFLGHHWYEDGKMLNKINTFRDIEAVARYLIDNSYTTPDLMSIEGASAGGLLAGYCLVKSPHLFNSVIANVPFVDVLNTMSDPSIPLTTQEWEQWGNPNCREYYDYISQYSPYDNIVCNTDYPNYYVTGGLNDPRVQYFEPTKFVAKLRHAQSNKDNKLQLLEIKMNDGHFNSDDRYKELNEIAKNHLFLLKSLE